MAGYGTEKFQTTSLRLGMPSAFAARYAKLGETPRFAPLPQEGQPEIMVGHDFQSQWHQQKMADAMRMVRAKVESTRNMYHRANSAPNNCPGFQAPVLGQRVFANPSAGALQSGTPSRIEYASAPFHYSDAHGAVAGGSNGRLVGGVLRTAQGQAYGKSLLNKRFNDFNAIDAAEMEFTLGGLPAGMEGMPQPQPGQRTTRFVGELPSAREELGLVPAVELAQLLQSVLDSLQMGLSTDVDVNRFTVGDSIRSFSLIVRVATSGSAEDIADILEFIEGGSSGDGIIPLLRMVTERPVTDEGDEIHGVALTMMEFWTRVMQYLKNMVPLAGRPARERTAASQAYIKTLKFTKMFQKGMPEEFATAGDAQEAVDVRSGTNFRRAGPGAPRSDDGSSGGPPGRRDAPVRREDSQHGYFGPGSQFSYDDRQRFGYSSGEYSTGGRPVGYSGVAAAEYGEYLPIPTSVEEAEGEEEYEDEANDTVPGNAGPRLTSARSAVTGEYDVFADTQPNLPRRVVGSPAGRTRSVTSSSSFGSFQQNVPSLSGRPLEERVATGTARARNRYRERFSLGNNPAPVTSRDQLPNTLPALRELAAAVNSYYGDKLPDGSGPLRVRADSKPRNVKLNFIRRLGL